MQGSICRRIQCHQYVIHNLLTPCCQVGQGGLKDQGGQERAWGLELPRGEDGMGGLSLAGCSARGHQSTGCWTALVHNARPHPT